MARQKEFNIEEKVEKAMMIFWEKGYHETSLADLTEATGLQKGSLYNTFGSKENLFLEALKHYGKMSQSRLQLGDKDPIEHLKAFFTRLVDEGSQKKKDSKGCLIMNTRLEFGHSKEKAAKLSSALYNAIGDSFQITLERAIELELIPSNSDVKEIANTLLVAAFSIREMSKFNKDRHFLKLIANNALERINIQIS